MQEETKAHGRMISMNEAKKMGLKVEEIALQSELWNCLCELFVRANWVVSVRSRKIMETTLSGIGA